MRLILNFTRRLVTFVPCNPFEKVISALKDAFDEQSMAWINIFDAIDSAQPGVHAARCNPTLSYPLEIVLSLPKFSHERTWGINHQRKSARANLLLRFWFFQLKLVRIVIISVVRPRIWLIHFSPINVLKFSTHMRITITVYHLNALIYTPTKQTYLVYNHPCILPFLYNRRLSLRILYAI